LKNLINSLLIFLSGCIIYDIPHELGNHSIDLPEHTLIINTSLKAWVIDIDSMKLVDSLNLGYEWPELRDREFITGIESTPEGYIACCVDLKYARRYIDERCIRVINPRTGKIVKEISVYPGPSNFSAPFYLKNGHKYVLIERSVVGENVVSVIDLTSLKMVNEFVIDDTLGKVSQDKNGNVYFSVGGDSAGLYELNPKTFAPSGKLYQEVTGIIYNDKIFKSKKGAVYVYDTTGNIVETVEVGEDIGLFRRIGNYIVGSDIDGTVFKINVHSLSTESVETVYGTCVRAYSPKLNILFGSSWPKLRLTAIDFDDLRIVGYLEDLNRDSGPMVVIE